jgi:hypothetical protein
MSGSSVGEVLEIVVAENHSVSGTVWAEANAEGFR